MRGKVSEIKNIKAVLGITPAYAGKSLELLLPVCAKKDHPRVCGEKTKKIP